MAADYYSMDEVCELLGVSSDEVRKMVAEGRLREVRDGAQAFYRKDQVDQIAAVEGSSVVDLTSADDSTARNIDESDSFASALQSLADSSTGLSIGDEAGEGSGVMAAELNLDDIPQDLPAAPKSDAGDLSWPPAPAARSMSDSGGAEFSSEIDLMPSGDDTHVSGMSVGEAKGHDDLPDLGLSGSSIISLEPSGEGTRMGMPGPATPAPAASGKKGISVFEDDELAIESDPMGETQISSGVQELETVGSGSGLLDLTRESDDTSLGAELLDVISPTEGGGKELHAEPVDSGETVEEASGVVAVSEAEPEEAVQPFYGSTVTAAPRAAAMMAGAVPMNICLLVGIIGLTVMGLATAGSLVGVWPEAILGAISRGMVYGVAFGVMGLASIVLGLVSILADRK